MRIVLTLSALIFGFLATALLILVAMTEANMGYSQRSIVEGTND